MIIIVVIIITIVIIMLCYVMLCIIIIIIIMIIMVTSARGPFCAYPIIARPPFSRRTGRRGYNQMSVYVYVCVHI